MSIKRDSDIPFFILRQKTWPIFILTQVALTYDFSASDTEKALWFVIFFSFVE
jgi:hypothetical protein